MLTLDTNILIYHLDGDEGVRRQLQLWLLRGERLFVSEITRLELLAVPALPRAEESAIRELLTLFVSIPVDARVAEVAAALKRKYRLRLGDSIIAATAYLTNSRLVTRNLSDFRKVKEIRIESI